MGLENETDLTILRQAVRLLEQENRKLIRLNLELRQALAEAKGAKAQQLELQIAALEQTLASRNRELFGDSSSVARKRLTHTSSPRRKHRRRPWSATAGAADHRARA